MASPPSALRTLRQTPKREKPTRVRSGCDTPQVLGNVGTWNVFLLIASLINGLVLLNAANVVVNIIACYLMGLKSPFFKSAVIEDVNFREQYARYAAHVIAPSPAPPSLSFALATSLHPCVSATGR